ncbi:MAG: hypothetical protein ACT4RN_16535 [Pseudonocardia sp.]
MSGPARRPGVVTFIGIVIYIQAALALVAAIVLLAFSSRLVRVISDVSTEPVTGAALLLSGIVELVLAALLFYVAAGIMRGNDGVRMFVAVVEGLRMAAALVAMLYYHDGAFVESGLVTILIGIFVLWALYGNERSDAFFTAGGEVATPPAIPVQPGPPEPQAAPPAQRIPAGAGSPPHGDGAAAPPQHSRPDSTAPTT